MGGRKFIGKTLTSAPTPLSPPPPHDSDGMVNVNQSRGWEATACRDSPLNLSDQDNLCRLIAFFFLLV